MIEEQRNALISEKLEYELNQKTLHDYDMRLQLGAMTQPCDRHHWYRFRWATAQTSSGLQHRNHIVVHELREFVLDIVQERIGHVTAPAAFSIINNHFSAKPQGIIDIENEFEKITALIHVHVSGTGAAFNEIVGKGFREVKPEQYEQICVMARQLELAYCLYIALNRNDSALHVELVPVDVALAIKLEHRAQSIIYATAPPERINESPAWWVCKSCSANEMCHRVNGETKPVENCRTCQNAYPVPDGKWHCNYFQQVIPDEYLTRGSDNGCGTAYTAIEV